jgi:high frequency lysogenization protein
MIFKKPEKNQIIALSGIFQSCYLVRNLSRYGLITEQNLKNNIQILFNQNTENIMDLYGSIESLHQGINSIKNLLASEHKEKLSETLRYAIGVMHLAKKLQKDKRMLMMIKKRLEITAKQIEHFSITHPNIIASISKIYQDSFGKFFFRINVNGNFEYLKQDQIVYQIRCLLFSGVRSAMLFHQMGGRRYQLILNKKHILEHIKIFSADM